MIGRDDDSNRSTCSCSAITKLCKAQLSSTVYLWKNFKAPLLVIWIASFGGALHAPVTTYFYLRVGATEKEIGFIGSIGSLGGFLAPFYGWMLDKYGPYPVIKITCLLCALGCLIRGLAPDVNALFISSAVLGLGSGNLWTAVLSFISQATPVRMRSTVISSYLVQVSTLRILGKSLYPVWHALLVSLAISDALLRDRITMSVCTFFCIFGFVFLLLVKPEAPEPEPLHAVDLQPLMGESEDDLRLTDSLSTSSPPVPPNVLSFAFCVFALGVQAVCITIGVTLWPLYLRDNFGWDSEQYAWVLFLSSWLSTAAVAVCPHMERVIGATATAVTGCLVAAITCSLAFTFSFGPALHCVFAILFGMAVALLEPALTAMCSFVAPVQWMGSAFGCMAAVACLGQIVGSIMGTQLYAGMKDGSNTLSPFTLTSGLLVAGALVVPCGILCAPPVSPHAMRDPPNPHLAVLPKRFDQKNK